MTNLSITSDYRISTGCPQPYLARIAEAGFTHVHWCHHWCTDFLYDEHEIGQIARWLEEFGLGVTDLHASAGQEKCWTSPHEYEREAGITLVANRIRMAAALGTNVIILHLVGQPGADEGAEAKAAWWERVWRSLDALAPIAEDAGVRIALENGWFDEVRTCLGRYGAEFLGLCYDAGHGNLAAGSLQNLAELADRLISIHLHDNDGQSDKHWPPGRGTVDWAGVLAVLADSSYGKWISMESTMRNVEGDDEPVFLAECYDAGMNLSRQLAERRGK